SAAPGASTRSPLTEAMTHAAASPDASVTGIPLARAASHSRVLASFAAQKSRGVPARRRPSTTMSATVLRLTMRETLLPREALEHRTHPLERRPSVRPRVRVRDPEIALAGGAERRARQPCHAGLVQEPLGHLGRRAAGAGDIREDVEGAARPRALHARQSVQAVDEN